MSLSRFFLPAPWQAGTVVDLPDEVSHHALKVLRLAAGDDIEVFDGAGASGRGSLVVTGRRAQISLHGPVRQDAIRAPRLTLAQGIASGDKMDWIVEKATELGVDRVVPIAARRSVLKLQGERRERRWQHWQRVAQAACAQCGRNTLPDIAPPATLEAWLAELATQTHTILLCDPQATESLVPWLQRQRPAALTLMVGPEGGWAPEELTLAQGHGVVAVRHGAYVLRTETAGLALSAACAAVLGWHD